MHSTRKIRNLNLQLSSSAQQVIVIDPQEVVARDVAWASFRGRGVVYCIVGALQSRSIYDPALLAVTCQPMQSS